MIEAEPEAYDLEPRLGSWRQGLGPLLKEWLLPQRNLKRRIWPVALGLLYIAVIGLLGGLRADHVFIGLLGLLDAYNEKTRLFLKYFFPFILTGVAFDSMRYYYWPGVRGHVHVAEPYLRDLRWFGIQVGEGAARHPVTPNEFFVLHTFTALDVLCGFAYLVFVSEYLLAAFGLFFTRRWPLLRRFGWAFFAVNVIGFITYFIYPAAPPWYVENFGLGPARLDVHPSAAAAHRFDLFFGTHFFDQMYGKGIDVFGAYPSLHVAYPFLVVLVTFELPAWRWARVPAIAFYGLMCFSAVYLQHHYIEDILLGTTYAVGTWWAMRRLA
jgi:membrane-associated phospholipid phosphatase